jgi:hypothetical protein
MRDAETDGRYRWVTVIPIGDAETGRRRGTVTPGRAGYALDGAGVFLRGAGRTAGYID